METVLTIINIICALINTFWAIYWIKRLEKTNKTIKELQSNKENS